jgi:pSer/pThr/pTyr-binding forkhead associated (FHA) protein
MAELDAQLDALDAEAEVEAEMEAEAEEEAYPDTDAQYPDTDAQYPDTDAQYPDTDAQYPDTDAQYPDTDAQYPDTDAQYPDTDAQYPDTDAQYPDTDAQYPDTDAQYPDTDAQYPDTDAQYPDTDAQYPDTGAQYPDTDAELKATAPPPKARWRPPDWSKLPVMHKPRLEMFENGRSARSMTVGNSRCFVFGRNGQVADIVVPDNSLSRAHAALINSSSATFIQDLDSAHGTYVDFEGRSINVPQLGTRLKAGEEPTKLTEGATIRFGSSNAVFRIVGLEHDVVQKWEPPRWAEPPSKPCHLEVRSHAFSNPYLSHLADEEGGDADELFALTGRCTLLGRSAAAVDVVLKDASISRQHAAVIHADGAAFLQDLGSASGSFVDGVQVAANKAHALAEGAVITLGECKTTYTYRLTAKGTGAVKRKR